MVGFRFPGTLCDLLHIVSPIRILHRQTMQTLTDYRDSVRQFMTTRVLRPMARALGVKGQKIVRFTERTSDFHSEQAVDTEQKI